jgi:putative chitinase
LFPAVSQTKIDTWIPEINRALQQFDITTYNRYTMFMAQTGHETDGYNTFVEYTNSAGVNGWCGGYSGGCKYRGRGAMQLTHNYNYKAAGAFFGIGDQFFNSPELVSTPQWAWKTAGWFWKSHNLNNCANTGDIVTCTRIINGGQNGIADRRARYAKAKQCLGQPTSGAVPVAAPPTSGSTSGNSASTCRINQDTVRLRPLPCTSRAECAEITFLNKNAAVTKTGKTQSADGYTWAEISAPQRGWVASQFISCSSGARLEEEEDNTDGARQEDVTDDLNNEQNLRNEEGTSTPGWVWAVCAVAGTCVLLALVLVVVLIRASKKPAEERF